MERQMTTMVSLPTSPANNFDSYFFIPPCPLPLEASSGRYHARSSVLNVFELLYNSQGRGLLVHELPCIESCLTQPQLFLIQTVIALHCNTKGSFPIWDHLGKHSLRIFILVEVGEDYVKSYNFKIGSV